MAKTCYHVTTHTSDPIFTSDVVLYNGTTIPCIQAPDLPTLNQLLEAIGTYICGLSPVAGYGSDDITIDADLTCIKIDEGDTLTNALVEIDTQICDIISSIAGFISEDLYDANTILKADADNTPVALTVAQERIVGRASGGVIDDLTAAQVLTILNAVDTDTNSTFPMGTKVFATGAGTTADKILLVPKENATFGLNPHLGWYHGIYPNAYESFMVFSKDVTKQSIEVASAKEDSAMIVNSYGTGSDLKDATLYLGDQTGNAATLRYWYLRKDGADSRNLKIGYYNGAAEAEKFELDTTNFRFRLNGTTAITGVLDEDNFASDSAVHVPTQQSVKAYITSVAASTAVQAAIITGAGLTAGTGVYVPDAGSTYLTAATSLWDADSILDSEIADINLRSDETATQTKKNVLCAMETVAFGDFNAAGSGVELTLSTDSFPTGSVITTARIYVTTPFTDDGANTSTIAVRIVAAGDINAASALNADYAGDVIQNSDMSYDYTFATPIITTAGDKIKCTWTIAGGATALTAGSMKIYVEYF